MWIECDTYIGPCRRGGKKLRLLDRRHGDTADRTPSLAALLRQLRANAMDLSDPNHRRRFKLRLTATIQLARRSQQNAMALELTKLDGFATERTLADRRAVQMIEQSLERAAAFLPMR